MDADDALEAMKQMTAALDRATAAQLATVARLDAVPTTNANINTITTDRGLETAVRACIVACTCAFFMTVCGVGVFLYFSNKLDIANANLGVHEKSIAALRAEVERLKSR